ncbi:MAG: hypothetical protein IJY61_05925 [Candidatus Gastranaerophilales bacterium]|nr:hypothetical protein [Candidatus Gastranaerophilales bacterium]
MNKKVILFNLLLIICFIFVANFIVYYLDISSDVYFDGTIRNILGEYKKFLTRDISSNDTYKNLIINEEYRHIENPEFISNKQSMILFGCSFTYGTGLRDDETFSYQLGKQTKQPIYNRAMGGWSVQHMLYQLKHEDFYKNIIKYQNYPSPEYIIFLTFNGHKSRIFLPVRIFYTPCYSVYYNQNPITKEFKLRKRTIFTDKIVFYYPILYKIYEFMSDKFSNRIDNIFYEYLIACKKEQEKHLPKTKFAIIFYDKESELTKEHMEKLEDNGFILITTEDLGINVNESKYRLPDSHPSALVWETATSKILEKLKN